ncbi:Flagellar hook protein FlgE [Gammaproteobacteria bacterium]|nr:flagellar hook protein FlgE [Gammaproteobacteria bacterium]QOJ31011.1 MAG: flagellar hook protein FlgE [Gammaproteobacteria bacterium]CAG0938449.1 Flagellar hook protein FlgE [Gammaproteobacteria bacterium]
MSFQIALSGLNAASTDLQVTSNNIANANTAGFKSSRAEFADVFSGEAIGIGNGVRLAEVRQEFTQGNVDITERQLDLAISGKGFFVVSDNGSLVYSRVGAFGLDSSGYVENSERERLQVYPPRGDGTFNTGALTDLRFTTDTSPPQPTNAVDMNINLPAGAAVPSVSPFDLTDPQSYNHSTSSVTYDSLGVAHDTTFYFIATAGGWNAAMSIDGTQVGTPQPFAFNSSGAMTTPANGQLAFTGFNPGNGAAAMNITLNMSRSTQYGSTFVVNQIAPDGQAAGRLRSFEVDPSGVVFARFSNGESTALGQIALANFSNPEGLLKVSDTSFQETFRSGVPQRGQATQSDFGVIQSGALESSNVDLTEQLVRMITSQRLFQANAQVISTLDTVTQTIINIR